MKVRIGLVGLLDHQRTLTWPKGWPIPREGDPIELADESEVLAVRTVAWYPEGSHEDPEPFVYVVVGKPRSCSNSPHG